MDVERADTTSADSELIVYSQNNKREDMDEVHLDTIFTCIICVLCFPRIKASKWGCANYAEISRTRPKNFKKVITQNLYGILPRLSRLCNSRPTLVKKKLTPNITRRITPRARPVPRYVVPCRMAWRHVCSSKQETRNDTIAKSAVRGKWRQKAIKRRPHMRPSWVVANRIANGLVVMDYDATHAS